MKRDISINNPRIIIFVIFGLLIIASHAHAGGTRQKVIDAKEAIGGWVEEHLPPIIGQGRAITIVNQTGYPLSGYSVKGIPSGLEIQKGAPPNDSLSIRINSRYTTDTDIEVTLVDRYGRIYVGTFSVPLEGNTNTPIIKQDRKSEGLLTDRWKDIVAWFNENK